MKNRVWARILTALGGVVLLALGAAIVAEAFFSAPVMKTVGDFLATGHVAAVLVKLLAVLLMLVLAVAAFVCAMPRKPAKQRDYVMQKGENGPIGISVRAIEKQVRTCIAKHAVIAGAEVTIREAREGIVILLEVDQVAGVSIPLSVGLLQKQVRQYVTGCTGINVHEVRVMVENNTDNHVASAYEVQDVVVPTVPAATEDYRPEPEPTVEPERTEPIAEPAPAPVADAPVAQPVAVQTPVPAPAPVPVVLPPVTEATVEPEEEEKPLHQRLFGLEEQPVFVPAPPNLAPEAPAEEAAEEAAEPEPAESEAETPVEEEQPEESSEDWSAPEMQEAAEFVLAESSLPMEEADESVWVGDEPQAEDEELRQEP